MENKAFIPVVLGLSIALGLGYYVSRHDTTECSHSGCSHTATTQKESDNREPVAVKEVNELMVEPVVVEEVSETIAPKAPTESVTSITTKAEFNELVLKNEKPVVVKAFAEWCGPCKGMAPHFKQVANEFKDSVVCVEFDVDAAAELATSLDISAMPTVIFFKNGKEVSRKQGGLNKEQLRAELNKLVDQK